MRKIIRGIFSALLGVALLTAALAPPAAAEVAAVEKQFVVDFGLPVAVGMGEFIGTTKLLNLTSIVPVSAQGVYGSVSVAGRTITYTPEQVMLGRETVELQLSYRDGSAETVTAHFVPATTVYYEETFFQAGEGWEARGTDAALKQTASAAGTGAAYGYDAAYQTTAQNSGGTSLVSVTPGSAAQFSFSGTGAELYFRTGCFAEGEHPGVTVWLYDGSGAPLKMSYVDLQNFFLSEDAGGYQTPCWTVEGLPPDSYTVILRVVQGPVELDGFRVSGTGGAAYQTIYAADREANPETVEVRDLVIAEIIDTVDLQKIHSAYVRDKAAGELMDVIYRSADGAHGAVILDGSELDGAGTGDPGVLTGEELIDLGPKNEIYLRPGQTLAMAVTDYSGRVQLGLRGLTGRAQCRLNGALSALSTVDLYYEIEEPQTITLTNTGSEIIAVTKLKVTSDDAGTAAAFTVQTTEESLKRALRELAGAAEPVFEDVPEGTWYFDYVYDLAQRGVVHGMTPATFVPEGPVTRAQFVKLLACAFAPAEEIDAFAGQTPFADCAGHWAAGYIAWARDAGLVEGVSEAAFAPDAPITREQMATILGRYAVAGGIVLPAPDSVPEFPDAGQISGYAREYVAWLHGAGFLSGYEDGTLRPQALASRAEAAKLFSLLLCMAEGG